jgi:hypothetical protein
MALSANAEIPRMTGELKSYLVADNVHIYKGALVCVEPTYGYATPGADTASYRFVGIAAEECDNTLTGHSAGGKSVRVWHKGEFLLTATSITQVMTGQMMYLVDDATVDDVTVTNFVPVGVLVEYVSTTSGWVRLDSPYGETPVILSLPALENRGGDADWVNAAGGIGLAKALTAKTAYLPVVGLQVGDVISAFTINAGVGAGTGKATTLDANLYSSVSKAGGSTQADLGGITQVSKEADTLVASSKTLATPSTVAANTNYYVKVTGTTADDAACDIVVTGVDLTITRKRG